MSETARHARPRGRRPRGDTATSSSTPGFDAVRQVARTLPGVEVVTRYDGAPTLKVGGCFVACLAMEATVEPGTLIVRVDMQERQWLLDEAPETYYLNDDHRRHPVVLVRLSRIDAAALRDLLEMARRLTLAKVRQATRSPRREVGSGLRGQV